MVRWLLFGSGSAAICVLSWRSLKSLRAHGFYRFFAFELLWALILLNLPIWFREAFSARQILSYLFGLASIGLAIEGFRLLIGRGRPSRNAGRDSNLGFENTTTVVSTGAYRYIRHPLYASLLAFVWAAYLKDPLDVWDIVMALAATGFLLATAMVEERENVEQFGPPYVDYMRHTRRFVPFLF